MANGSRRVGGMDLGDRFSHVWIGDAEGICCGKGRVATTRESMTRYFGSQDPMVVAIEVGTHSPWVERVLRKAGHEVIVANPRKVRLVYASRKKNDKLDAEKLARLARLDPKLLFPIRHRSEDEERHLVLVKSRTALVETRVQLINHLRGIVKSRGERLPKCSSEAFAGKAATYLGKDPATAPVVQMIAHLTVSIRQYDREIESVAAKEYPETGHMQTVSGVGPITALTFRLVVQSPERFPNARDVGPYLGLQPRQCQSGDSDPQLGITKAGDVYLRSLLVQASHYILGPFGPDTDLRRWGLALAARGGNRAKKRAVVAVARKLAVLLLTLWKRREIYQPLRHDAVQEAAA